MDNFFEEEQPNNDNEQIFAHDMDHAQLVLAHRDLDLRLLSEALRIAEKSLFWRFYSLQKKMQTIVLSYNILFQLLNPEETEGTEE